MKTCNGPICQGEEQDNSAFDKATRRPTGLQDWCRVCMKFYDKNSMHLVKGPNRCALKKADGRRYYRYADEATALGALRHWVSQSWVTATMTDMFLIKCSYCNYWHQVPMKVLEGHEDQYEIENKTDYFVVRRAPK